LEKPDSTDSEVGFLDGIFCCGALLIAASFIVYIIQHLQWI
jgi:hypothetical protein